jgi:xanthine dehydrogenase accessory factor
MSDWPFLFDFARKHRGGRLALATLVAREGSSYRQPGARMLIGADLSRTLLEMCSRQGNRSGW